MRLGRALSRIPLRVIVLYFLAFGGAARAASREFLQRVHGRKPTLREQYALFFSFASTIHDRVYFLKNRFELFDIEVEGGEVFDERALLLMGAHLGSFEAMRACGRHLGHRRVVMAMYEENARRLNGVFAAIDPSAMQDIVALGHAESMLELAEQLDAGRARGRARRSNARQRAGDLRGLLRRIGPLSHRPDAHGGRAASSRDLHGGAVSRR